MYAFICVKKIKFLAGAARAQQASKAVIDLNTTVFIGLLVKVRIR